MAQNAVNFISSTLAWLAIGAFASQTSLSGRGIDPEILSAATAAKTTLQTSKLQPILISPTSNHGRENSIAVPFMSRDISRKKKSNQKPSNNAGIRIGVKELPTLTYKQQMTFGDLSPEDKQNFIKNHLTSRNFIASMPFDKEINRRMVDLEHDGKPGKKLVKKIIKKVVTTSPENVQN